MEVGHLVHGEKQCSPQDVIKYNRDFPNGMSEAQAPVLKRTWSMTGLGGGLH